MVRGLWDKVYDVEVPYFRSYPGTNPVDADSDGDGVRDGADDQDHDDVPNVMECSRRAAAAGAWIAGDPDPDADGPLAFARVNPFSPCLPAKRSRTCADRVPVDGGWAPFNPTDGSFAIKN